MILKFEADSECNKIPIKFDINQKLSQWLPEYKDWGGVTIKQLLNMTSGIYSYTELPISRMILCDPNKVWSLNEIIRLSYRHKPNMIFKPGTGWSYTDTAYILAGKLIRVLYKKAYHRDRSLQYIIKALLVSPLKLNNTYYYPGSLPKNLLSRMVNGYNFYDSKNFTRYNLSIAGPAGAMIATPKSVADWIIKLFTKNVLPKKQFDELTALVSTNTGKEIQASKTTRVSGYSLGLAEQYSAKLGEVWVYKGLTAGYSAVYFYAPRLHTIVSYTINVGSVRKNPIELSKLPKSVLKLLYEKV